MSLSQQLPTGVIGEATLFFLLLGSSSCNSLLGFLQSKELTELRVVLGGSIEMIDMKKESRLKQRQGKIKEDKSSERKSCQGSVSVYKGSVKEKKRGRGEVYVRASSGIARVKHLDIFTLFPSYTCQSQYEA